MRTYARAPRWWQHAKDRTSRLHVIASSLGAGVLLATTILSGCAPSGSQTASQQQSRLDHELHTAQTVYHVPPSLLNPILTQEQQAAVGKNGTSAQYARAATVYDQLYQQVVGLEHTNPQQALAQTQADLKSFASVLTDVQSQGFVEAAPYQQALQQEQQQLTTAKTTTDYFTLDTQVQAELTAVTALSPTYQQLSALNTRLQNQTAALASSSDQPTQLQCAQELSDAFWYSDPYVTVAAPSTTPTTTETTAYAQWYAQDLTLFRAASTASDYSHLQSIIAAQNAQLTADQSQNAPALATQLLQTFQTDVSTYTQDGGTDTTYQQELTQDQQTTASHAFLSDLKLEQTLQQQIAAFQFPLLQVKTQHDMATLKQLVAQGQARTTVDPANGQAYPDAYEYADPQVGIGDAETRLANAQTLTDYQNVDREIEMFATNLTAMLKNLSDKTPADQVHQTDLQLLQYYGITSDKVIVVSVREQEARFYDNGKLVQAYQITSGAPDLPSPVGIHCVLEKLQHTTFISPDPKGSPNYYAPTPINYALEYSYYGYFLHDAWWRSGFGLYSNLPHYDPAAFNGGSHGCVNFPLSDAQWMYNWSSVGTPIILY